MGKKNKRSLKAELKRIRKNVEIANSSIDKISKKTKKKNQKILKQMHDIIEEASAESFGIEQAMRRMAGEDEEDIDQALSSSKKKKKNKDKGFAEINLTLFSTRSTPPVHHAKPIPKPESSTLDVDVINDTYEELVKTADKAGSKEIPGAVKVSVDADGNIVDAEKGESCPAPKKATRKTKKETKE